jgi:hypothetical protein
MSFQKKWEKKVELSDSLLLALGMMMLISAGRDARSSIPSLYESPHAKGR